MFKLKNPPHPGKFVRIWVLEENSLTVGALAAQLDVTRQAVSALLNEHSRLTWEMAIRIDKAFGFDAGTLMRMQMTYDESQKKKLAATINVRPYVAKRSKARA